MKWMTAFLCLLVVSVVYRGITWAGPAQGVTPTLIGRATFGRFKVKTNPPEFEGQHNNS